MIVRGVKMRDIIITEETEDGYWLDYKKTKNSRIREAFINQYAPLVKFVAGKVMANMPGSVEFDDLVSFGVFGLMDAVDKFDPAKDVQFKTYAVTRIRGAIYDELRKDDWVPRSIRQKSRELDEGTQSLEAKLGRTATREEIAEHFGISLQEYNTLALKVSGSSLLSLNETSKRVDESDRTSLLESIESPSSLQPDIIIEKGEVRRLIVEAIHELPEKEKMVLVLYYYEDLTLKEIGQVLEVTESRVSQLHTKAITRLRTKLSHIKKGIF